MTASASPTRLAVKVAVVSVAVVSLAGCAGGTSSSSSSARLTAVDDVTRLAERESRTRTADPASVPTPPGVSPAVLAVKSSEDPRAWLGLDAVIAAVARPVEPVVEDPDGGPTAEERDQALRHYAKGRDAEIQQRWFVAITELEKARRLDPQRPMILRELARSYAQFNNDTKAAALFEELLRLEPDDSETLFVLGLDAFNRRDFERAAGFLARPRARQRSFDHDPAAGDLADYMLATALRNLGYDRAFIELATAALGGLGRLNVPTAYPLHRERLYRQRAEVWRLVGDAHSRLGEYEAALIAYGRSADAPHSDPDALTPRIIYVQLTLGRPWSAQRALLSALAEDEATPSDVVSVTRRRSPRLGELQPLRPASTGEQDVQLCAYVARHVDRRDLLSRALIDLHERSPDDATLARCAAVLLPRADALALLRSFLHRRPEDLDVLSQLQGWLIARDDRSAVSLTVALVEDHPRLGSQYGDRLARAARSPGALLRAAEELPPSAARALVESRLLVYLGAYGRAWTVCDEALRRWPTDRWLVLQKIDIAARLEEPQLLEQLLTEADIFDDAETWLVVSRARRALGQSEQAVAAASRAATLDPQSAEAMIALANAHVALAEKLGQVDLRRQHAENAVIAAETALAIDPQHDPAYTILFALHAPNALLADRARLVELRDELAETSPASGLLARIAAQEDIALGRYERAAERLLAVSQSDPTDIESLQLVVAVWSQTGNTDDAIRWLEDRLEQHQADPVLLEEWVTLQTSRDASDQAMRRLEQLIAVEPEHDDARRLLAVLYRRDGRPEMAVPLSEQRLMTRPQAIRRELELAALYADAAMGPESEVRLNWILGQANEARFEQLAQALQVSKLLSDGDPSYTSLTLSFADTIVARFPDVPMPIYATALEALARLDRIDERFDRLASGAVLHALGGAGPTPADVTLWRALAQQLVNAGYPEAAARAVRARLLADAPLEPVAREQLVYAALVADAAAGRTEDSLDLIGSLALRGWLPRLGAPEGQAPPELPEVFYEASTIYSLLGDDDGAERLLREVIRIDPDHSLALNNLGYTRLTRGFGDAETETWIEKAHELDPDNENILDTVGWLRYLRGRFDGTEETPGALELIRASMGQSPQPSAEVLDHLGDTLWRLGNHEGAADAWRQATELLGDDARRERIEQQYYLIQVRVWGLQVADHKEIYHRQFGHVGDRAMEKLQAIGDGAEPPIARTFEEQGLTGSRGEDGNGRP